jgi:putative oxidoreductase
MDNTVDLLLATYPSLSMLVAARRGHRVLRARGAKGVRLAGGPDSRRPSRHSRTTKIPPPATVLAAFIECFGGLALIVGCWSPAAVGLVAVMLVAVVKVHGRNGFFINFSGTPGKGHGFEFNFVLIMMLLASLAGAGAVDRPRAAAAGRVAMAVIRVLVNAAAIWLASRTCRASRPTRRRSWWPVSCSA